MIHDVPLDKDYTILLTKLYHKHYGKNKDTAISRDITEYHYCFNNIGCMLHHMNIQQVFLPIILRLNGLKDTMCYKSNILLPSDDFAQEFLQEVKGN